MMWRKTVTWLTNVLWAVVVSLVSAVGPSFIAPKGIDD